MIYCLYIYSIYYPKLNYTTYVHISYNIFWCHLQCSAQQKNSLQHHNTCTPYFPPHFCTESLFVVVRGRKSRCDQHPSSTKFFRFFPVSLNVYCWICPISMQICKYIYNIFSYSRLLYVMYVVHAIIIQNNVVYKPANINLFWILFILFSI